MAMHILMATVDALGISTDDVILNRTSLHELREENRHHQFGDVKSEFFDNVIQFFNF